MKHVIIMVIAVLTLTSCSANTKSDTDTINSSHFCVEHEVTFDASCIISYKYDTSNQGFLLYDDPDVSICEEGPVEVLDNCNFIAQYDNMTDDELMEYYVIKVLEDGVCILCERD